jgi:ubiquinone biosynthesis accessory factor UbiJ
MPQSPPTPAKKAGFESAGQARGKLAGNGLVSSLRGYAAYNSTMLNIFASLGSAAMERITLLLNHVIAAEPVATERLRPHSGRSIQLQWTGWPGLLPSPPVVAFVITPAGLLEWCGEQAPAQPDLRVTIDASNPLRLMGQWLSGERPQVGIEGDSALAADVSWLIDNLRWEVSDDLSRFVGPVAAQAIARVGRLLAQGLREALRLASSLAPRRDPGPGAG